MSTQLSLHDVTKSYDHPSGARPSHLRVPAGTGPSRARTTPSGRHLDRYAGALVVVTHDRRFVSRRHGTTLALKETSLANH